MFCQQTQMYNDASSVSSHRIIVDLLLPPGNIVAAIPDEAVAKAIIPFFPYR
ncbi:uncharacterized protein G2W53_018119 [Senna tora]|uniref:Uncharacterized protein n=1 Tax=Senna tora TaxID=362788 RepID=A0A834WKS6_9FABA|nr:uncharacterized protein G2W53_018119 [Senna tora]